MQDLPEDGIKVHLILLWITIKFLFQCFKSSLSIIFIPTILDVQTKNRCWVYQSTCYTKPHNAPVPYPTMHQFITEMCTILLQNRALWVIFLMHRGICEIDHLILLFGSFYRYKSPSIDSHIGFKNGFSLIISYLETVINMHLWYMPR